MEDEKLKKLRRWALREKQRFNLLNQTGTDAYSRERAFGEANVCALFINKIDELLKEKT